MWHYPPPRRARPIRVIACVSNAAACWDGMRRSSWMGRPLPPSRRRTSTRAVSIFTMVSSGDRMPSRCARHAETSARSSKAPLPRPGSPGRTHGHPARIHRRIVSLDTVKCAAASPTDTGLTEYSERFGNGFGTAGLPMLDCKGRTPRPVGVSEKTCHYFRPITETQGRIPLPTAFDAPGF